MRSQSFRAFVLVTVSVGLVQFGCENNSLQDLDASRALPGLVGAKALSRHYVEVEFASPPGVRAEDASLYSITAADGTPLAVLAVFPADQGRGVVLQTDAHAASDYTLHVGGPEPDISAATQEVTYTATPSTVEPQLLSAVALSNTTVLLNFDVAMDAATAGNALRYRIDSPDLNITAAVFGGPDTKTVTLTTSPQDDLLYTVKVGGVKSTSGQYIDPAFSAPTFYGIAANDVTAPRLLDADATSYTTVRLSFSEPVENFANNPANYAISPSVLVLGATPNEYGTQVLLTTLSLSVDEPYTVTVSNVEDRAGRVIVAPDNTADFTFTGALTEPSYEGQPPRVVGAISINNIMVDVHFSKPMGESAADPEHYRITGPDTVFLFVEAAALSTDGTTARLTTTSQADYLYTVQAAGVKDLDGNPIAPPSSSLLAVVGLDPTKAAFFGTPPASIDEQIDTDGDGFADWFENAGWLIRIGLANGDEKVAFVTSDPNNPDTDGDGFTDGEENAHNWDPRTNDTDADILDDWSEFNLWYSDPADQDTDDDGIDDLSEVTFFRTSPILRDTDGDGFSDDQEIGEMNRNPRLADLPLYTIETGEIRLQIDERYSFTDAQGRTVSQSSSSSTSLSQSQDSRFLKSDTSSWQIAAEIGGSFGVEGGKPTILVNPKISGGYESITQTDTETSSQSQQAYESSLAKGRELSTSREVTREIVGASVDIPISLQLAGDIAFTITNMEVSVLQMGRDRTRLVPVATLVPNSTLSTGNPLTLNLGPFVPERGPILFGSRDVFPNLVEELMREARGLIIKVANFDLTDEFGRNYAFTSQEINDRTASLTVDYGDGTVDRFRIAVNGGTDSNFIFEGTCAHNTLVSCDEDSDCDHTGTCARRCKDDPDTTCTSNADCDLGDACRVAKTCSNEPEATCLANVDCNRDGTCVPVTVGGFNDFGRASGIPLDFALQDILGLVKNSSVNDSIIAGADFDADTLAIGDDVQRIPKGTTGLDDRSVVVLAGENGVLDTAAASGDALAKTTGYETSPTCNGSTVEGIYEPLTGGDGKANTPKFGDDVQVIAVNATAAAGALIISVGPNGVLDTIPTNDDQLRAPGLVCTANNQCPSGLCNAREGLRRFKNSVTGESNRLWRVYTSDSTPVGTDFGRTTLSPSMVLILAFEQDLDRDGLSAREEYTYGSSDRFRDSENNGAGDGISDFAEIREGWLVEVLDRYRAYPDPRLSDSDADTVSDSSEKTCATDPRKRDTDGDGLTDAEELNSGLCCAAADGASCKSPARSCKANADCTAVTGFTVCVKILADICPPPVSTPTRLRLDPRKADTDGDTVDDGHEFELGANPLDGTDANNFRDSDEDGLTDAQEIAGWEVGITLCNNRCSGAFDGTCDDGGSADTTPGTHACVLGADCADCGPKTCNPATDVCPVIPSDPSNGDGDFDGLPDLLEQIIGSDPDDVDTDGDGILDYDEFADFGAYQNLNSEFPGFFLAGQDSQMLATDLRSQDSDGDRLSDDFELLDGWRVLAFGDPQPRNVHSDPLFRDSDLDGRDDKNEFLGADNIPQGRSGDTGDATDPTDPDTDSDGTIDGVDALPLEPNISVEIAFTSLIWDSIPSGTNYWIWNFSVSSPGNLGATTLYDQCDVGCTASCTSGFVTGAGLLFRLGAYAALSPPLVMRPGDLLTVDLYMGRQGSCDFSVVSDDLRSTKLFTFDDLKEGNSTRVETFDVSSSFGTFSITVTALIQVR